MSNSENDLSAGDVAEILSRALELAIEAGLVVGVRDAPATERRSDGIMIYVSGLRTENGAIVAQPAPEVVQS